MCTNNKIVGGALCLLLSDDSIHAQTILEIESIFGIDSLFPEAEKLALTLHSYLILIEPCSKQKQWFKALAEIYEKLKAECRAKAELDQIEELEELKYMIIPDSAWMLEESGEEQQQRLEEEIERKMEEEIEKRKDGDFYRAEREANSNMRIPRNRLKGHFKDYPLAAFFLQNTRFIYPHQFQIVRTLWLAALFKNTPVHELNRSAELILTTLNLTMDELHALPMTVTKLLFNIPRAEDPHKFYEHLKIMSDSFNCVPDEIKDEGIAALGWLVGLVHEEKKDKLIAPPPPVEASIEPKKIKYTGTKKRSIEAQPDTGKLTIHKINLSRSIDNEPPEFINLFALNPENLTNENGEGSSEDEIVSESEIDQQTQESRYWLIRHEKIVPTDYGRFTLAERMRIAQFITDGIVSSDTNKKLAAGLIGTMYVTGLSLEDLFLAHFGNDQTFKIDGVYRREIRLAQDAFSPNKTQINHISPIATELLLQLPEPIAEWLADLYTIGKTLGKRLGVDLEEAKQHVHSELETLRANGCYQRIRAERIPSALAIETTIMFRDPLITFLLAAKPTQGAPRLSYYVTHSVEKLSQCYERVTKKMVNPCII